VPDDGEAASAGELVGPAVAAGGVAVDGDGEEGEPGAEAAGWLGGATLGGAGGLPGGGGIDTEGSAALADIGPMPGASCAAARRATTMVSAASR